MNEVMCSHHWWWMLLLFDRYQSEPQPMVKHQEEIQQRSQKTPFVEEESDFLCHQMQEES
uniref:Uncharacterized protein n=1 Tax=Ciona intestinalis TaxID=7719 RepID=H2XJM5_CIOIN